MIEDDFRWGIGTENIKGRIELYKRWIKPNGTQHAVRLLEKAGFISFEHRRRLTNLWRRKYQIRHYPHLYYFLIVLDEDDTE